VGQKFLDFRGSFVVPKDRKGSSPPVGIFRVLSPPLMASLAHSTTSFSLCCRAASFTRYNRNFLPVNWALALHSTDAAVQLPLLGVGEYFDSYLMQKKRPSKEQFSLPRVSALLQNVVRVRFRRSVRDYQSCPCNTSAIEGVVVQSYGLVRVFF